MPAVVHFDADGEIEFHVTADTELFIVDDRAPNDRVYIYTADATNEQIATLIGDGEIGHSADARHAAIEARIVAHMNGERHLKPVKED